MIGSVQSQLVTVLRSAGLGINAEIDNVATARSVTGLPTLGSDHIYGLDAPVDVNTVNTPALILTPLGTRTDEIMHQSMNIRDSVHRFGFEFATDNPNENAWRTEAVYVGEALMRVLDAFNANNTSYAGSSGVIKVIGWDFDFAVTWSTPPNARRGFVADVEILARDTITLGGFTQGFSNGFNI